MKLALSLIREDGGTQARAELIQEKITEYAERIETMTPIVVYYDGTSYWLADGFHRVAAAEEARVDAIEAEVRQGSLRDAIFHSLGANANHGIPRSIADKRRAVERMLADEEWATWSDRRVAETCQVSHTFVANIRAGRVGTGRRERGIVATATLESAAPTRGNNGPSLPPVRGASVGATAGLPPPSSASDVALKAMRFESSLDQLLGEYGDSNGLLRQAQNNALDVALPQFSRMRKESR